MFKFDYFVNDVAKLGEHCLFVIAMATCPVTEEQSGGVSYVELVLVRPSNYLGVPCAVFHFFDSSMAIRIRRTW